MDPGYAKFFEDVDEEGFCRAFSISQEDWSDLDAFFDKYGFVVVRDCTSQAQVDATVDEVWQLLQQAAVGTTITARDDPSTWENNVWNGGCQGDNRGFVETSSNPFKLTAYWQNYLNPKIVALFQHLLDTDNITWTEGRFGFMRPTRNIRLKDDTLVDRPEWKTTSSWLHWDQNPWKEPGFCRLQGLLALTDHTLTSGGFTCVPGFHMETADWAANRDPSTVPDSHRFLVSVPSVCSDIHARVVPILLRQGDFLASDSRLPHCNYPNSSSQPRICQYVRYATVNEETKQHAEGLMMRLALANEYNAFVEKLSPLGRRVLHLDLATPFDSPTDREAIDALREARELEEAGEHARAIVFYNKAFRACPRLEDLV